MSTTLTPDAPASPWRWWVCLLLFSATTLNYMDRIALNQMAVRIQTALKMGIAPRAEISRPEEAKRYLDMGVNHFCIGTDMCILFDWFKGTGGDMNKLLGRGAPGAARDASGYARQTR